MEVYGLTGGIGSGKSTVAAMLEDYGIPVVSADELSRMVVAPGSDGLTDVVAAFGAEVLDERGELDRKKMGQIVLEHPDGRRQLESILHPRIRERYEQVLDALEKAGHPVMVYEVPLLFEKKLDQQDEMRAVILVSATADTRIARLKARDSLTTDDVIARMRAQMPEDQKRARADYIIHNDGELDDLRVEVEHLLASFLRIPKTRPERPSTPASNPVVPVVPVVPTPAAVEEVEEIEVEELELDEDELVEDELVEDEHSAPTAPHAAVPEPVTPTASAPLPATPASPAPAMTKGELEVELHPTGPHPTLPNAGTSGSAWIPAPGPAGSTSQTSPPVVAAPPTPTAPPMPVAPPTPAAPPTPVAPPTPAAPAAPAAPQTQAQPSASGRARPRMSTIPQLEVPDVTAALAKELFAQKKAESDGESNS